MKRKPGRDFYLTVLCENLFPFWDRAVDRKTGGIFTCFDNSGRELLSRDKYTWSQGRFLWMWSRFADHIRRGNIPEPEAGVLARCEEDARKTVRFLLEKSFMDNGNVIFLLSETGETKTISGEAPVDASIYADCFICLGFSEYARVFREGQFASRALELYRSITGRIEQRRFYTEPYPVPPDCAMMGIPMFAMYTGSELAQALSALGNSAAAEAAAIAEKYARILENDFFIKPYNLEVKGPGSISDTLLARHLTPGHIVECLWFYIHFMEFLGKTKERLMGDTLALADTLGRWALDRGWDAEQGGIFRFIDREGGEPQGRLIDDPYEKLIRKTWDTKLWWVHSESLYFSAFMAKLFDAAESANTESAAYWRRMEEKIFNYTFSVFPNPDVAAGEWIQIRRRDGSPLNEVVALPVKDPYHIFRNMLLLLEL
jgi:N-acylglucosamine 2-epimerase